MNATGLEQLSILFEHLEYLIGDFEDEYGNFCITSWSLDTIFRRLFSAWFWNLDSHVYLRSINKVRIYPGQLCCIKSRKRISHPHNHEVINGPQALSRVLLLTQRVSFYDTNKWELLWWTKCIFENCDPQQGLLYRRIRISVNKAGISLLFYTYFPITIFHGRWITLSSLAHTHVYDLHLIVSKFKTIR